MFTPPSLPSHVPSSKEAEELKRVEKISRRNERNLSPPPLIIHFFLNKKKVQRAEPIGRRDEFLSASFTKKDGTNLEEGRT